MQNLNLNPRERIVVLIFFLGGEEQEKDEARAT